MKMCFTFRFIFMQIQPFSYETFSRGLVLKQRHKVTWKWLISVVLPDTLFCRAKQTKMSFTHIYIYIYKGNNKKHFNNEIGNLSNFIKKKVLKHIATCLSSDVCNLEFSVITCFSFFDDLRFYMGGSWF